MNNYLEIRLIRSIRNLSTDKFLHYWLLATVFIIPLLVFNYGYNASAIRQLILLVLVIIGWLIWAGQAVFGKKPVLWQRTIFNWIGLILLAAVLISAFSASDQLLVWGLRGGIGESNPFGWLAVLGLGLLVVQNYRITEFQKKKIPTEIPKFRNSEPLLNTYLFSSTILALFVIIWWLAKQELIMPALTSFAATSLWFSVNAVVIAALASSAKGKSKLLWLVVLLVHLAVIFGYDYDLAWYVLAGGALLLAVTQLILEKRLPNTDYRIPFALIVISIGLLFAPVQSLSNKLGFDASRLASVGPQVSYTRFFKYNNWPKIITGHGLGQGAQAFWEKAELVDMSQTQAYPPLGAGLGSWLWEGGVLLVLAFLAGLLLILRAAWRQMSPPARGLSRVSPREGDSGGVGEGTLGLALGVLGYLVILVLLPFDWLGLLGLYVFMSLATTTISTSRAVKIGSRHGERSFLSFGAVVLAVFLVLLITTGVQQIKSRLDFFNSINVQARSGTTVNLIKLDKVIKSEPKIFGYRLARVDFITQALNERANSGQAVKAEEVAPWLEILNRDYDALSQESLSGQAAWQLANSAISIANIQGGLATTTAQWLSRAETNYRRAIEKLPRNVILFTEVARFYRQSIPTDDPKRQESLGRAQVLLDQALAIDNTYQPAILERAELLILLGKNDEALEAAKTLAKDNPNAAYSAGRLAFSARKFEEAIGYYKQAIADNPNHLQARYELVQAYLATGDSKSAGQELDELEKRTPTDDVATRTLLKGLRELVK